MRAGATLGFLLAAGLSSGATDEPVPVLTVCEALKDTARYDGKTVVVVGRLDSTSEGGWLNAECGFTVRNGGRDFRPSISVTYVVGQVAPPPPLPLGFKWDRGLLREKISEVKRSTKLQYKGERWEAVFGRLETRLPANMAGFGHLNGAPAQLIWPARAGWRHL